MAKIKKKQSKDLDGVFVLKLVLYAIIGSLWLKLDSNNMSSTIPVPLGLIIGLIFSTHEHFRIDRKIEYAVLVLAALVGLIAPYGLFVGI